MRMQQDAVKQSNTMGVPLDFDIDWAVSNLLKNNDAWKSFATDEIGGKHFLWSYLQENEQAFNSGEIPDEMLHPDSFNPEFDTRLHKHYSDRIKKAFNKNYKSPQEELVSTEEETTGYPEDLRIPSATNLSHSQKLKADELMNRLNQKRA